MDEIQTIVIKKKHLAQDHLKKCFDFRRKRRMNRMICLKNSTPATLQKNTESGEQELDRLIATRNQRGRNLK